MQITLLDNTKLISAVQASRLVDDSVANIDTYKVWHKYDNDVVAFNNREISKHPGHKPEIGPKDKEYLTRIGDNHIVYTFKINGISYNLAEKLKSFCDIITVKELRFMYKHIKDESSFCKIVDNKYIIDANKLDIINKYVVLTGIDVVDNSIVIALENLRLLLASGNVAVEHLIMCNPMAIKTEVVFSITAHQIKLLEFNRFEERKLLELMLTAIPDEHKFLFN